MHISILGGDKIKTAFIIIIKKKSQNILKKFKIF